MGKGKYKCEMLRAVRETVARRYDLKYMPTPCNFKGDCFGTCPKCDAELQDLQRQLDEKGVKDISLIELEKECDDVPYIGMPGNTRYGWEGEAVPPYPGWPGPPPIKGLARILKDLYGPFNDQLRIVYLDEESIKDLAADFVDNGFAYFRWTNYESYEPGMVEEGDHVVFFFRKEKIVILYLTHVCATGDGCAEYVNKDDLEEYDGRSPYVIKKDKGPVLVNCDEVAFLEDFEDNSSEPDTPLSEELTAKLNKLFDEH